MKESVEKLSSEGRKLCVMWKFAEKLSLHVLARLVVEWLMGGW
jgi:hypothetical protein